MHQSRPHPPEADAGEAPPDDALPCQGVRSLVRSGPLEFEPRVVNHPSEGALLIIPVQQVELLQVEDVIDAGRRLRAVDAPHAAREGARRGRFPAAPAVRQPILSVGCRKEVGLLVQRDAVP